MNTLHLLPQSPITQIPTHLKWSNVIALVLFLTEHTIKSLEAFYFQKKLQDFDPHVGETACQIRAYQVLLLTSQSINVHHEKIARKIYELGEISERLKKDLLTYKKIESTPNSNPLEIITLQKFLYEKKYDFTLRKEEFFIVLARFLTIFKTYSSTEEPAIDYKKLINHLNISKNTARKLVHYYQVKLSELSCDFIMELNKKTSFIDPSKLQSLQAVDDDGRHIFPCYPAMKIIYKHMLSNSKIILLVIERKNSGSSLEKVYLLFVPCKEKMKYVYVEDVDDFLSQEGYIIEGVVEDANQVRDSKNYIRQLLFQGLERIIFLNMASHPQYSGKILRERSHNPFSSIDLADSPLYFSSLGKEFLLAKQEAELVGCSLNNPLLFYITHIYCDALRKQLTFSKMYMDGSSRVTSPFDAQVSANIN